jgi:hypothetical protein
LEDNKVRFDFFQASLYCRTYLTKRAFEHILQSDRNMHGDNTTYSIPDGTTDTFQNSVDDVVAGTCQG